MNYILGIDLGTTYSCVGIWKNNKVEIISNSQTGKRITPSVVYFKNKNETLIGFGVNDNTKNYENIIYDSKRLIGRNFNDEVVQNDMKLWPFKLDKDYNNKPQIIVKIDNKEKRYYPEEISAKILYSLKKQVEEFLSCEVKDAIITVPAYFNNSQRQSTIDAGKIAGLNVLQTINEPTAAAIAYGLENQSNKKKNVCIFDFGGGTFDVTILTIENKEFKVLSTGGDSHLGGADIDNLLVKYCINEFKNKTNIDISNNTKALRRLKKECVLKKEFLSSLKEVDFEIDSLNNQINLEFNLKRIDFENICMPLFEKCIKILEETIKESGLSKEQIDDIVLVGGSSRIPKIQEMIKQYFKKAHLNKNIQPDEAIAIGATMLTAKYDNTQLSNINDLVIADVVPLSLGLKIENNLMDILIKKNTTIPCLVEKEFETCVPYQKQVDICIYEGENEYIQDNFFLDQFSLNILKPEIKNYLPIKFEINAKDSLLKVSVNVLGENNSKQISIKRVKRKEDEINKMINKGIEERKREEEYKKEKKKDININKSNNPFNENKKTIKVSEKDIDNFNINKSNNPFNENKKTIKVSEKDIDNFNINKSDNLFNENKKNDDISYSLQIKKTEASKDKSKNDKNDNSNNKKKTIICNCSLF